MRIPPFPAVRPSTVGLIAALLSPCTALANDPGSTQLRDQQRELRQLEQQQRLERWQRPAQPDASEPTRQPSPSADACWPIPGVRLAGNRLLPTPALEQALKPLLRPCMNAAAINALLKAITERYVLAGYPLSRPLLARTRQAGEPLFIFIAEGFVESIELHDDLPLSLRGAFPSLLGQPLYLPDLEQGLDQLNRLRAFDLGVKLLPGEAPGGTQVVLASQRPATARWHLDSRLDNRGSDLTGRHRLTLGLGLDSPLGLNDELRLSRVFPVLDAPGRMFGSNLYYSLPYGLWTFALNASQLAYRAPLPGGRQSSSGSSQLAGVSIERLLWRNAQGLVSSSLRLDHKRLVNRLGSVYLGQQSPTLTTLEAGLNLLWLGDGVWMGYLGLSHGLGWFGADRSPLGRMAPEPAFRKYRASLMHLRSGPPQQPWRWASELSLQYSPDLLPAVEQMPLTDDQAVRGFRQHVVSGASGAVWRNTLSYPLALLSAAEVRPHLGLDLGWGRYSELRAPGHRTTQRLAGAALGVEISRPDTRLRLDYQRPLHLSGQPRSALERGFWVLDWTLTL
ncbi:ShlB/FhaC/HecB family hemolysin secretion/activation protein [Pseudomonas sp. NPDC089554]|uniref:ShlB/FhaC/HecB family hemolysin secretion/activation protein n=1 Tax=Pseudomonas sp. NPDC089554 TaxID=3390653 RepID=UPI003CFE6DBD